jgi:two-component system phosphate regulon response regulator PhoB
MKKPYVLIVEDEEAILEMISLNLHQNNFIPQRSINAEMAEQSLKNNKPDLILLDWMLPGMSGIDFLKRVRINSETKDIPVIMLTAKAEEDDKVRGLDVGADDYIAKPFSPKELIARIKAILRRNTPDLIPSEMVIGKLKINPDSHTVSYNENQIKLGPTEFKILYLFMTNNNRVLTREKIVNKIWGNETEIDSRTIDVHIKRLRASLKNNGLEETIETVRGSGYKLSESKYFE